LVIINNENYILSYEGIISVKHKDFIVIRCPRCGKWTYAKVKQKTRLCSRCEKSFRIDPVKVIYADSHQHAHVLVKNKNQEELRKKLSENK
jgi:NADH pyrophosphatase NudC (nudix superfamily)